MADSADVVVSPLRRAVPAEKQKEDLARLPKALVPVLVLRRDQRDRIPMTTGR